MKVLFLDIDGVCNSSDYVIAKGVRPGVYDIDPVAAQRVKRIVAETGCEVVLSSTWRHDSEGVKQVEEQIVKLYDKTPSLGRVRGDEIKRWLEANPQVDRYAIVDDDDDMLKVQLPNFFKTTFKQGLTDRVTSQIIAHLNRPVEHVLTIADLQAAKAKMNMLYPPDKMLKEMQVHDYKRLKELFPEAPQEVSDFLGIPILIDEEMEPGKVKLIYGNGREEILDV